MDLKVASIWATFVGKFVTQTFQKYPNLVTLNLEFENQVSGYRSNCYIHVPTPVCSF